MSIPITEALGVHREWYDESRKVTLATLPEFLRHLTEDYGHDYGTICHAVAAAAIAAARAVDHSPAGGITGFQAGAIMWEFVSEWQGYRGQPLRLVKYEEMLYPQYDDAFAKTITPDTWDWLQKKAAEKLAGNSEGSHPDVLAHWESIVAGIVPFGYEVKER